MPESSRSTMVIWLVAAVLAVMAGVKLLGGNEPPATPVNVDNAPATKVAASRAEHAQNLYVHVAGAVHRPGLVELPAGTRVATALERAGGPTRKADLTLVNLAARVQDGQQIVVPAAGGTAGTAAPGSGPSSAPAAGAAPGSAAEAIPGVKIHLSTATVEQLDQVDGIGPTLAARIIEYRDAHSGFRSLQELAEVDGIGEKRLATLREALQP